MNIKKQNVQRLFICLLFMIPSHLAAQYWGEQVLEKEFEQTDFFFKPSNLLPYGLGSFKSTTLGILNDPLQELAVNPALLKTDSAHRAYLYFDFRSARTIIDESKNHIMPWMSNASVIDGTRSYPWMYLNTRRELEPVFSGAVMGVPLPDVLPALILGGTYQLVLQDEKYYDVPQDIYQSVMGSDFSGNKVEAASSLPIVDRTSGDDNMHQKGHFISTFGRIEIPTFGSVGMKLGRVLFDRSGEVGSTNLWSEYSNPSGATSSWSNRESRSQSYNHWELTGGAEIMLSGKTSLGVSLGQLWGKATQSLRRANLSYYNYPSPSNGSLYFSNGDTQQDWGHDGSSLLYGMELTSHINPVHTLRFMYQHEKGDIDLSLRSGIRDTSFSTYSYTYLDTLRTSVYDSFLRDARSGSGKQIMTTDRAMVNVQWQMDERTNLSIGVQYEWQKMNINTTENVLASMLSESESNYYEYYRWISGSDQSKDLHWAFTSEKGSLHIPVFLTMKVSDALSVLLGLNRSMISSKVTEVTLAATRYNQSNYNGVISRNENYGERYTTPSETVSDVRTTFLAGITAAPSKEFRVRLLVVPQFRDTYDGSRLEGLQWWISINILP
jgi:hypothetical protein